MNIYQVEPTKHKPRVLLDPNKHILEFEGFSLPEDATDFYIPIVTWIYDYSAKAEDLKKNKTKTSVTFKLAYYNSASFRAILEMLQVLNKMRLKDVDITTLWYCDSDDVQMYESIKELSELSGMPISIITVSN